jgi:TolB-like protein
MRNLFLIVFSALSISGCGMNAWTSNPSSLDEPTQKHHKQDTLHRQIEILARQLFSTSQAIDGTRTVAIGTILPAFSSSGGALPLENALGVQIQESLMTFATQAGMKVIEYKTMPAIKIGKQADAMLSRNVAKLNNNISADYFLTGTYTTQENSTIINIRLIQVPENIVLAAATDYVPNDAMWSKSKISLKNNQIYRSEY